MTIWDYPGLEKDTFYAFAFYAHLTRRTISALSLSSHPLTHDVTRAFLDRQADCFAWTKLSEETAENVTATAILKGDQEEKCKVLIAKKYTSPSKRGGFR